MNSSITAPIISYRGSYRSPFMTDMAKAVTLEDPVLAEEYDASKIEKGVYADWDDPYWSRGDTMKTLAPEVSIEIGEWFRAEI